ncbi:MAG TPA: DUF4397 domain-containing protein [Usitatibacter sp.]|nr:DUF4397 domain-containing protein [Usitatibacter sp.]
MKRLFALLAAALLAAACHNGGINQNSTELRALNAVPDAEPLDVLVDGDVKFGAVPAGGATSYANFDSGAREVVVRSSTNQAVLYDKSLTFSGDARGTLVVFGRRNAVNTLFLVDDTTTATAGKTRIRFAGAAADAGSIDVYLTTTDLSGAGPAVISAIAPAGISAVSEVTAGSYKIILTAAGTQDVLFQSANPVTLNAGANVTLAAVPSIGGKLVNAVLIEPGTSGAVTPLANPIARIKAANAIADSTALNFKADGAMLLTAVPFAGVSSYVNTAAGSHALQLEASNVPGTNIASTTRSLEPARDYTMLAAGTIASPSIVLVADDNTLPAAGNAKLRFVNALAGGNVDALVNFASQAAGIAPATASQYFSIGAGTGYTITFTTPGGVNGVASLTGVELDSGNVYTAYVFGTASGAQAKLVRDR